ncbi:hypothetical protein [Microbulbifer variabilis]|uniref:hypothetical protein n=1 Tax=Microbulbifer variabilis TaxID=266805 RepID=UPI001CFEA0A6|nr:hypothetical protein [Microbulbifer variabilis]
MYQPYAYAQGNFGQPLNYSLPPISTVAGFSNQSPYQVAPQMNPQGFLGDIVSRAAPIIGGIVGGPQGHLINSLGGLGQLLPFQALPQIHPQFSQQMAPQNYLGEIINRAMQQFGGYMGGPQGQFNNIENNLSQLLPYQAVPQFSPQGLLGELISRAAPAIGNYIGGQQGQFLNNVARLGQLLPFQALPQFAQQLAIQPYLNSLQGQFSPLHQTQEQFGGFPNQMMNPTGGFGQPTPYQMIPQQHYQGFQNFGGMGQPYPFQAMQQPNSAFHQQSYLH